MALATLTNILGFSRTQSLRFEMRGFAFNSMDEFYSEKVIPRVLHILYNVGCFMAGFFALLMIVLTELWLDLGSLIVGGVQIWSIGFFVAQAFYASGHLGLSALFTSSLVRSAGITPGTAIGFQIAVATLFLNSVSFQGFSYPFVTLSTPSVNKLIGIALIVTGAVLVNRD